MIRERLENAGTMDDLFCEYEQISKAKLRGKTKRRLEGAEAESEDDDEAAAMENPEEEAEALKMATDAGHGATGTGTKGRERDKACLAKSRVIIPQLDNFLGNVLLAGVNSLS